MFFDFYRTTVIDYIKTNFKKNVRKFTVNHCVFWKDWHIPFLLQVT